MSTGLLLLLTAAYMFGLSFLASAVDRSRGALRRLARHPMVNALALGVYASSWTYFGSVGSAATDGLRFLAIYIGATISCALVPVVWAPLANLCRERQLASIADLLSYRYHSRSVGALVSIFFLAGSLPYQALQLKAAAEAVSAFAGDSVHGSVALAITVLLLVFALLYGVRHISPLERHDGFVAAVALESLVKLVALLAVAIYTLYAVHGGKTGLDAWLVTHPQAVNQLTAPARERSWVALLLLSAAAIFLLPRQWHVGFTEGSAAGLRTASWALPAYLFLLNITVPILLWGGQRLGLSGSPEFYLLGICRAAGSRWLSGMAFLGALSASSAMIVVTTLSLASMLQNQVVIPFAAVLGGDLYRRLLWIRRSLVFAIIWCGYGVFELLSDSARLADLGLVSFVAVAQVLPGLLGVMLWTRATARGALWGLAAGAIAWLLTPILPLFAEASVLPPSFNWLRALSVDQDPWGFTTAFTLGINGLCFVLGSLSRAPNRHERQAAEVCRRGAPEPNDEVVDATSSEEFIERLAPVLGEHAAQKEVQSALDQLNMSGNENAPEQLRSLRDRLEKNLSGLFGPITARMIVDERLAVDDSLRHLLSSQLRYVEEQLSALRLTGPLKALEEARKFLRDVLYDLPLGVCVVGPAGDIALWNRALSELTGIATEQAFGKPLAEQTAPWGETLAQFVHAREAHREVELQIGDQARSLALHRAAVDTAAAQGGCVMLLEDRTLARKLEAKLAHQDRLASIGRLAAGVAHEIGNPLTAVASVAQNLKAEATDEDLRERLGLIVSQTKRIDRIVRGLLGFARAGDSERLTHEPEQINLRELAEEAVTLVRLAHTSRRVSFSVDVPAELRVRGSRQRIEQVLVNLLNNACDASPDGATVALRGSQQGERARIQVCDHGSGMSPEVQARAFEPFFTTKREGQGNGLGLSITYGIVVEHGGTLSIESQPGAGTTVTVELPHVL